TDFPIVSFFRYNVEPPGLIKLEKEIEQEEIAPLPSPVSLSPTPSPSPSPTPAFPSPTPAFPSPTPAFPSPTPASPSPTKCSSSSQKSTGKLLDDAVKHISEDPPCKCPNKLCVERGPGPLPRWRGDAIHQGG
uniref:GAR domain-containing protein n=1 Tax=Hucho hucho TaxID=62062 RepID=A0A4W5RNH6_9TELE